MTDDSGSGLPSSSGELPEPPAPRARVLVVDDDAAVARSFVRILSRHYDTRVARNGAQALAILDDDGEQTFDAILCDVMMPVMNGLDFYRALSARYPALVPRLAFVTAGAIAHDMIELLEALPCPRLSKPVEPDLLLEAVEALRCPPACLGEAD